MNTLRNCLVVMVITFFAGYSNAALLQLDFQSNHTGDAAGWSGVNDSPTASGWTNFEVEELGPTKNTTTDPSITVGAITFAITGTTSAWPGNDGADPLFGDYLFLPGKDGKLGANKVLSWSATGLTANTDYVFTFYHGPGGGRNVTIDSQALQVVIDAGNPVGTLTLMTDGAGAITGTATGGGKEGDWAAVSIDVPEPATMALLGLGGLAMIRRRK